MTADTRSSPVWERLRRHRWFTPVGLTLTFLIFFPVAYWNEYESPWGRASQAAKLEHLQRTICK